MERRSTVSAPITLTNSLSTTPVIPYGPSGGGILFVQSASGDYATPTSATLTWYAAFGAEETKTPVVAGGNALTTAVEVGKAYPIPAELFGAPFIAAVTDAGTLTVVLAAKG
jgi:hypothetical protein